MKHRSITYLLIFVAIIFVATLPFIFRDGAESINQTLNLSATIISSLAAVVTLWIALLLFNKYGVESPLVEKSSSKVFDLLEQIKATRFSFGNDKLYFNVGMSDPFKYHKQLENYYKQNIIFSETYIYSLEKIFEISSNPFMPPPIFEKVDRLQFFMMSYDIGKDKENDYLKVQVMGDKKLAEPKFGRFNGADLTVFEFLNILEEIKTSIEKWVGDNSTIPVKLNL